MHINRHCESLRQQGEAIHESKQNLHSVIARFGNTESKQSKSRESKRQIRTMIDKRIDKLSHFDSRKVIDSQKFTQRFA